MSEFGHAGKTAFITGASKGIGEAIAIGLAQSGASVAVGYHTDAEGADRTVAAIAGQGGDATAVQLDLANLERCLEVVDQVAQHFGRLDILVNNAARTRFGPVHETTEVDFDDVVNTVLKGPFFLSLRASKIMNANGGGAIVNISSIAVEGIMPFHGAYTMAKGGLESMTRQMALDLAPHVRVNAVAPGATLTARNLRYSEGYADDWSRVTPLGRVMMPGDYVGVVNFLTSEAAQMITGQIIYVDGGWSMLGLGPNMDAFDFSSDKL
ncbi:MAG: SDR family oxidoreductase [Actinomycetia bacterium]|nr:SDR family oxidoreductase [Actinomycetes bacterium]